MSHGHSYDMVLLPPRHPTDGDHELSQPRRALRWYHRSRQARAARRRRAQRNRRHRLAEGDGIPRSGASQPDVDMDFLAEDLCRMSLAEGKMPIGSPIASPPSAAPPLASSTTPALGTTPSSAFLFRLDSVARAYASSISTSMSAYEELPGHHLRSTLNLVASTPSSEYLDSTETLDTELCATAFRHHDPRDARPHMHPLYYYLALQTPTLPMTPTTRLANASISMELSRRILRTRQPWEEGTRHLRSSFLLNGMRLNSLRIKECSSSKSMSCRTGSMRNEIIYAYFSKPSSKSARRMHTMEELERESSRR
jgi:hypothetical protein